MKYYFFDTSALVKRYIIETGSNWVNRVIADVDTNHTISRLTESEVSAALTRRLESRIAQQLLQNFDQDLAQFYTRLAITDQSIDEAVSLTRRYRLLGCDAIQLATVLQVAAAEPSTIFVCADTELLSAASALGLVVENPEVHP